MKRDISFRFPDKTITFEDIDLPDADTPLPPTNATIHLLADELGYGTPDRTFIALCRVQWAAKDSSGEHKYVMQGDGQWHKHINCGACRRLMKELGYD